MTPTSTKLSVYIESDRVGYNVRGEFIVSDILFSDLEHKGGIDEEQMIADVKQCIKALKGFKMLTISLTDGEQYSTYPKEIDSVRFTNHYGGIKMAYASGSYYNNWVESNDKHIYTMIRKFVHDANALHSKKKEAKQLTAQ